MVLIYDDETTSSFCLSIGTLNFRMSFTVSLVFTTEMLTYKVIMNGDLKDHSFYRSPLKFISGFALCSAGLRQHDDKSWMNQRSQNRSCGLFSQTGNVMLRFADVSSGTITNPQSLAS